MAQNLDTVRAAALARIDRSERNFKIAFFVAAIIESAFIVSFLLLADFSNRMHVLLLICYSIVGFGLIALGAHINRGIARLLKALELRANVD